MKRPPSLDRPATPEPEAPRVATSVPKPRRTRKTTDAAASVVPAAPTPVASDLSTATTEPITLPVLPSAATPAVVTVAPVGAPVVAVQRPDEKPKQKPTLSWPKTKRSRATAGTAGTAGTTGDVTHTGSELQTDDPAALTPSAARKQLRAATKARKHYERGEVRRFTWRSRRRRRTWLVVGGVVLALAAFVVVGTYSPLMALKTIEVVGTNRIPAADIQAALSSQVGVPLPIVDGDQIKRELSTFTLIQSYSTESRPPNTLVVRVVERVPVGLLATPTGFDLVDAAGVVLQSGAERVPGYPVITATNGVGHPGFTAAAAVIRVLPEGIRTQLDSVTAATTDDVTLTLAGGARVVWGSAERSEDKAAVLASLMVSYPPGSVGEYDVTSPDSAVLR